MAQQTLLVGCVADDFTGAGDAASFLAANGVRTVLYSGIPDGDAPLPDGTEAVVIALKSRTQETQSAVADSLAAFGWLHAHGADMLYFKYCSTFDSTPQGNIGPVMDAVLERYGYPYTVVCPALLENQRSVRGGILYVDGVPLAESHMSRHPLTPMWDSDIAALLKPQAKYPCLKADTCLLSNPEAFASFVEENKQAYPHFSVCADFYRPEHGALLMERFHDLPFLTGGSGLLAEYAKYRRGQAGAVLQGPSASGGTGRRVLFAGSCSAATQGQVRNYLAGGGKGVMVKPSLLRAGSQTPETLWRMAADSPDEDILFYSAGSGGVMDDAQDGGASLLEQTMAGLAQKAAQAGCTKIIVAGGETSGAVTQAFGYRSFLIGETVAPGVPVMSPTANPDLRIVLKSGNFGGPAFLQTVLK